jgi:ferritin-like metal-binding protein YciE
MGRNESLQSLYVDQLRDLYSAEDQILDALPKMIKQSSHRELADALDQHLHVTEQQVLRLKEIFTDLNESPTGETCEAMAGIIKEGKKELSQWDHRDVLDAAIIASAQRVEHYEMAAYGTTRAIAQTLGFERHAGLLQQTLDEEGEADHTLTGIAEQIVYAQSDVTR